MNVSRWFGLMMAALAACGAEPVRKADGQPAGSARSVDGQPAGSAHSIDGQPAGSARNFDSKPTAPVSVQVESKDLGNRRHQVTLTAVATDNVDDLRLTLVVPEGARVEEGNASMSFGATSKGGARTLVRHVILAGDGGDLVVDVRTNERGLSRNRPLIKRLGQAAPAKPAVPTTTITLPDGQQVEEVRQ